MRDVFRIRRNTSKISRTSAGAMAPGRCGVRICNEAAAEKFLAKHLGGRYQESMTPAITERMAVLTVDPKTVVLAKKVAVPTSAPTPVTSLTPGTITYKARFEVQGQTLPVDLTRTLKDQNGVWLVTEDTSMPMGTVSDSSYFDKSTLRLTKRVVHQGPVVIDLQFADTDLRLHLGDGFFERH